MAIDIRTRVELKNETQRETIKRGTAGKVALIGAFPSSKDKPFAAESFAQVVSHYNVELNSATEDWYGGVRAAKRIFMEGIKGYSGANSITCVNICKYKPVNYERNTKELYLTSYSYETAEYDLNTKEPTSPNVQVNTTDKYTPTDSTIKDDTKLTFDKLQKALTSIGDEDMDMLFIANDLWEIIDTPLIEDYKKDYPVATYNTKDYTVTKVDDYIPSDYTTINIVCKLDKDEGGYWNYYPIVEKTYDNKERIKSAYEYKINSKGSLELDGNELPIFYTNENNNRVDVDGDSKSRIYIKRVFVKKPVKDTNGNQIDGAIGLEEKKSGDKTSYYVTPEFYYNTSNLNHILTLKEYEDILKTKDNDPNTKFPDPKDSTKTINGKVYEFTDGDTQYATCIVNYDEKETKGVKHGTLQWQKCYSDDLGNTVYGVTPSGKFIRNIGDIYDFILDFIDNEFTNHRPVNYIGAIKTRAVPEGLDNTLSTLGLGSDTLRIFGDDFKLDEDSISPIKKLRHTNTSKNPHAQKTIWGALDIAKLFTRTTNELSTCGLFYQRGVINDEEVDEMELAAHMCGWICSINLSQDLTYQTIPGLKDVEEEAYLGENDAGTLLNQAGIQIIRPKSRLDNTWYVNNSIQPTGWHTNHIRSVTYLLKRLQFESGLGMNNFTSNLEAYRAILDATAKEVLDECEIIRRVEIGDIEVLNNYHIYVPINIVLAGVVTLINIGVSMELDETGRIGTTVKTTTGYSVSV